MSARAGLSTSTAILLASGLVAVSIFFGLRGRAPEAPAVEATPPAAPEPVVAPPRISAPELVARQASEALAYQRTRLRDLCYRPAAIAAGEALPAAWVFNVTFDARGAQLARGMVEQRGTSTPELTRCVGEQMEPLLVPPPGATIMVEVPLSFP